MKYIFPFTQVNIGSRIVLYGASDIDYDYYRQIMSTGYADLIAWLDSNYEMYGRRKFKRFAMWLDFYYIWGSEWIMEFR